MAGDLNGQTLAGRYQFEATVGEGTFARVYRVHDTRRSVDLAAKVLRTDIAHEPNFVERFRREGDVLARLQHPNIVRYYDLVEAEDYVFILMEYVPGQTLQSTLYRLGQPLSPREALEFLRPLSAALHFAHGEGVIHRDLKPANVLMHENGNLLVTDFGIARLLDDAAMSLTGGRVLGTPLYMAPEQISGDAVTPAADVYALGVLLYQMLTTNVPFDGTHPDSKGETTSERVTFEHLNIPPRPLQEMMPAVDEAVEIIVMQCLAKDPAKRPDNVRAVYDALAEAVGKVPFDFEAMDGEPFNAPPAVKLPEVSQFEMAFKSPEAPDAPAASTGEDTEEMLPQQPESSDGDPADPHAQATLEAEPVAPAPEDDPAATLRANPLASLRASLSQTIARQASVQAPRPMPQTDPSRPVPADYHAPDYAAPPYDEGLGFDPMRFLLIGVALASLACIALVVYAIDPFGGDNPAPGIISDTQQVTPSPDRPTATQLGTSVASNGGSVLAPPGSSDGRLIAYASRRTGTLQIYTIEPDGSNRRLILDRPDLQMKGPAWSPDGQRIAFYAYSGDSVQPADIYVMDSDGGNLINLTDSPDYNDLYVNWSPDGRYVVFHSNRPGQDGSRDYEIYRMEVATGQLTQLTLNSVPDYGPAYSPDGRRIAFFSYEGNKAVLYSMNADGSNRVRLSPDDIEGGAFYPAWSPDGSQLAFHVEMAPNTYQIYLIDASGENARPMMDTYVNDQFPAWSADGSQIVFQRVEDNVQTIYRYVLTDDRLEQVTPGLGDFLPNWQPIY